MDVVNSTNFAVLGLMEGAEPVSPTLVQTSFVLDGPTPLECHGESHDSLGEDSSPSLFLEINVCAPETPIMGEFSTQYVHSREEHEMQLGRSVDMDADATGTAHLRPLSTLMQLSPDDPWRTSVGLYLSFHLQMQSAEMPFDLLNDKISFLGGVQDLFWAGTDDGPEFDEVCLPQVMMAKLDMLMPAELKHSMDRVPSPLTAQDIIIQDLDVPPVMSSMTEMATNIPLHMLPTSIRRLRHCPICPMANVLVALYSYRTNQNLL